MSRNYIKEIHQETVRFHIDFGPPSLFERVRFKMKDVHKLYLDGTHFNKRLSERDSPEDVIEKLKAFDCCEWTLKTAEVRKDRGKFVNSTWEVLCNGNPYWVTISVGNFITTIVLRNSSGMDKCIRNGEYYDFVESVNRKLMNEDLKQLVQ